MEIIIILYLMCGLIYTRRIDLRDEVMKKEDKWYLWVLVYLVGALTGFPEWIYEEWRGE